MIVQIVLFFRILKESAEQAIFQLLSNKLRTSLSLMGITIGIWCVIMVFSAVDSLEENIKGSFQRLGDNVIYVSKFPWNEDPSENFWKYMRRPDANYSEFARLKERMNNASLISFSVFIRNSTLESQQNEVSNVFSLGVTKDYKDVFNLKFDKGRFFNEREMARGANTLLIGYDVAEQLFAKGEDPIGKYIKFRDQRMQIVGVFAKEGKSLINPINFDGVAIVPYQTARKFVNIKKKSRRGNTTMAIKAAKGVSLSMLQDQLTGELRAARGLKPKEENNFSLNTLSLLASIFENIFGVIRIAGFIIGIFSILVGGFSVANIMFVSVKERTNLIGVKKALGAKQYIILIEFLVESIILCLIGGFIGLFFVYWAALLASKVAGYEIFLSYYNVFLGLSISVACGVVAGIVPAYRASKMVPVEAIRS